MNTLARIADSLLTPAQWRDLIRAMNTARRIQAQQAQPNTPTH
ncbi:hypothetical protein [Hymenobacter latericus]|nr:hypothetical protein [Hymenobacter sp. YIM 151858-1]UYZ60074.1 hypothetical protein OIS50_04560 [Hymenobacter sp. YIM 151858-1]